MCWQTESVYCRWDSNTGAAIQNLVRPLALGQFASSLMALLKCLEAKCQRPFWVSGGKVAKLMLLGWWNFMLALSPTLVEEVFIAASYHVC